MKNETTELTKQQFIEVLKKVAEPKDIKVFQVIYNFNERHEAAASEIAAVLEMKYPPLNSQVGRLAKKVDKIIPNIVYELREDETSRRWNLFFNGRYNHAGKGKLFYWQLRTPLVEALQELSLTGELKKTEDLAEELPEQALKTLPEGAKKSIVVNAYERNPKAREECVQHYGTDCVVCGFNFGEAFGELGEGFIHVHHLKPISSIGKSYEVNPVQDLRPVCPNCHAMLHRKKDAVLSIDELIAIRKSHATT
ncbi:MAG: HNH endonuclease [Thiotrichaceae bacterium]|nr:HNH endonuclease [Thiotrichaceae bacterium]